MNKYNTRTELLKRLRKEIDEFHGDYHSLTLLEACYEQIERDGKVPIADDFIYQHETRSYHVMQNGEIIAVVPRLGSKEIPA